MAVAAEVPTAWQALLPAHPVSFPPDFLWGVASSAFQAEGGDVPNDWVAAARAGRVPPNPGNGFWEQAEEDLRLVARLGLRHYRLSVEWSRVEPERGRFDEAALDRYRAICDAARSVDITPWVNLFHFTHPCWLAERGGLLDPANHADFLRYVEHAGRALVGHATYFHVSNESMVYVLSSYLLGQNPPFLRDRELAFTMTRHVLALHAAAYGVLKGLVPSPTVATIEVYLDPRPADPESSHQCASARRFDAWYHGTLLHALATGCIELPGREPEEIPGLAGALDLYGFNYYSSLSFGERGVGSYTDRPQAPEDEMGRHVFPRGLEEGLLRVAAALPRVPLVVTENGCPTSDETFRIRYIAAHLAALARARDCGADVRGYFHWTAVDNYEWHRGFAGGGFGLIGFDSKTKARTPKRSALWLEAAIKRCGFAPQDVP